MRTTQALRIVSALLLCLVGTYILVNSIRSPNHFAEAGVLVGGILIGLALFPLSVAIEEHRQISAMAKHMRSSDAQYRR